MGFTKGFIKIISVTCCLALLFNINAPIEASNLSSICLRIFDISTKHFPLRDRSKNTLYLEIFQFSNFEYKYAKSRFNKKIVFFIQRLVNHDVGSFLCSITMTAKWIMPGIFVSTVITYVLPKIKCLCLLLLKRHYLKETSRILTLMCG